MNRRILAIERLRALAALFVIFFHLGQYFPELYGTRIGSPYGVNLFFVISGYVVSRSFLKDFDRHCRLDTTRRFYARRFFRIVPLALFWCAVVLAGARWFNRSGEFYDFPHVLEMVIQIITLRFNYFYAAHTHLAVLGHYWSLMVEEHFYLVLPVLLAFLRTNRARLVMSLTGIACVVCVMRPLTWKFASPELAPFYLILGTHARLHELLAGVAINLFQKSFVIRSRALWTSPWAALACWGMLAGLAFRGISGTETEIFLLCVGIVFIASFDGSWVFGLSPKLPFNRILEYIGSRSYGIYLAHIPLLLILSEFYYRYAFPIHSLGVWTLSYFALLLSVTELCYRWIERPGIVWERRRLKIG